MLEPLVFQGKRGTAKLPSMSVHEQIKRRRERRGWSMDKLAQEVSKREGSEKPLSWQTVQQWENGTSAPRRKRLEVVAALFNCTVSDLLESSIAEVEPAPPLKGLVRLPVLGEVKGGEDGQVTELQYPPGHGEGFVEYPSSDPDAYALRVRGDSMHPRFRAGEFVVIEPNIEPQDGDDVIVQCYDGRNLLKQLNWRREDEVQLLSVNANHPPLTLQVSEIASIQLVSGRVRRNALRRT